MACGPTPRRIPVRAERSPSTRRLPHSRHRSCRVSWSPWIAVMAAGYRFWRCCFQMEAADRQRFMPRKAGLTSPPSLVLRRGLNVLRRSPQLPGRGMCPADAVMLSFLRDQTPAHYLLLSWACSRDRPETALIPWPVRPKAAATGPSPRHPYGLRPATFSFSCIFSRARLMLFRFRLLSRYV